MLRTVNMPKCQVHVFLFRLFIGRASQKHAQHSLGSLPDTCPRGHYRRMRTLQLFPAYVKSWPFKVLSEILLSTEMKEYTFF